MIVDGLAIWLEPTREGEIVWLDPEDAPPVLIAVMFGCDVRLRNPGDVPMPRTWLFAGALAWLNGPSVNRGGPETRFRDRTRDEALGRIVVGWWMHVNEQTNRDTDGGDQADAHTDDANVRVHRADRLGDRGAHRDAPGPGHSEPIDDSARDQSAARPDQDRADRARTRRGARAARHEQRYEVRGDRHARCEPAAAGPASAVPRHRDGDDPPLSDGLRPERFESEAASGAHDAPRTHWTRLATVEMTG